MSGRKIRYPNGREIGEFARATGLTPALVIRDVVRIAELFHLLDDEILGSRAVVSGGMALRLFASTRISLRDLDVAIIGAGAFVSAAELAHLLAYEDPGVTIVPTREDEWERKDLYSAAPLRFEHRFDQTRLSGSDSWLKVDVSLRGTELKPLPMAFIHGYPFKLGVEGALVNVMHPIEMLAEKTVAYGIFRLSKHLADLAYMSTALPAFIKQKDWLSKNADEIRRVARLKFEANLERHSKTLAEQEIETFDDMRASFEHPERFNVEAGWAGSVFFHGRAGELLNYDAAVIAVRARILPVLWTDAAARA